MIVDPDGGFVIESKEEAERFLAALEEFTNESPREPSAKAVKLSEEERRAFMARVKERYSLEDERTS